jgi:hypothetical protein
LTAAEWLWLELRPIGSAVASNVATITPNIGGSITAVSDSEVQLLYSHQSNILPFING